jgi:hypothetical protein
VDVLGSGPVGIHRALEVRICLFISEE